MYFLIVKINNLRGDLIDVLAKQASLVQLLLASALR